MSAFMVSNTHIDALLTAGLHFGTQLPLSWYDTKEKPAEGYQRGAPWGPGTAEW